jgi:hypothetical protein
VEGVGGGPEECAALLQEYLVDIVKERYADGLHIATRVVEDSKPTLPSHLRIIKTTMSLTETVLMVAYASPIIGA